MALPIEISAMFFVFALDYTVLDKAAPNLPYFFKPFFLRSTIIRRISTFALKLPIVKVTSMFAKTLTYYFANSGPVTVYVNLHKGCVASNANNTSNDL